MKSRQLGFVLMALIAVGVAGLAFRIVSAGSDEIILEGLIQVSSQASDRVLVEGGGKRTELQRLGDAEQGAWYVDDQPVFAPQLQQFWQAVDDLYDAQLVSVNPANHGRMGVVDGEATEVSFFLGRRSLQEKFLIGTWKPDVRLCYAAPRGIRRDLRRPLSQRQHLRSGPGQVEEPDSGVHSAERDTADRVPVHRRGYDRELRDTAR